MVNASKEFISSSGMTSFDPNGGTVLNGILVDIGVSDSGSEGIICGCMRSKKSWCFLEASSLSSCVRSGRRCGFAAVYEINRSETKNLVLKIN